MLQSSKYTPSSFFFLSSFMVIMGNSSITSIIVHPQNKII